MKDEVRQRIVKAALGKLKNNPEHQVRTATEHLVQQAMNITNQVRETIKPVLKAGGWKDKEALRDLITRTYLDHFTKLTKDELENLATMLHVEIMMESVDANPWAKPEPDLLSGHD